MITPETKPHSLDGEHHVSGLMFPSRYLTLLILTAAGLFMVTIGWLKWPDLLIDFGEQVYVPWQLSEGKVLYRDINYLYGPLSSYLHAFLFQVFGESIRVLILFNILIIGALAWLIYDLFFQISDQLTATVCSLAFILLFAFGQYGGSGNFNFVCAYTYDLPHGVALSLLCLHQFLKFSKTHKPARLMAASFLAGLVFLTKFEVFVALSVALFFGMIAYFKTKPSGKTKLVQTLFPALTIVFIPPLLFWIYFSFHVPWSQALYYLVSPWLLIQNSSLHSVPLYQWIMGTNDIGGNVFKLLAYLMLHLMIVAIFIAGNRWLPRWTPYAKGYSLLLAILMLAFILLLDSRIAWLDLLRPLPLITFCLSIFSLKNLMASNTDNPHRGNHFALFVLSLFSFMLLLKMLLNTHLFHYGFALAMPATLIFLWVLVFAVPNHRPFFNGPVTFYRNAMLALILIFMGKHVGLSYDIFNLKNNPVGTERNFIMDYDPRISSQGTLVQEAVQYINRELPANTGLATITYGNMINFMTRHPNPLRYPTFNPGHALLFGEDDYFENLKSVYPDHILLVDVDSSILGPRYFGRDYARPIYSWIVQNYKVQKQFGQAPFQGKGFGIQLLRKKLSTE